MNPSAKLKSKIYYDTKINPAEIKIGDNVFLLKGGKIKETRLGTGNVKIDTKGKPTAVHVNRLKRSHINIQT